jgi:putative aldouronate transport system substrate-binding protein
MKRQKMFGILTSVLLISGLLAGCGSNSDSNSSPSASSGSTAQASASGSAAPADAFAKHLDVSIAYMDIATVIKNGQTDPILDMVQKKFNITIKPVNESWGDYGDRTKLWASSGQLPDAFFFDQTSGDLVNQWADQGIIKPLPEDMSAYPTLQKLLDLPDVKGAAAADGKNYFVPRMLTNRNELPMDRGLYIRKDWMEELGLKDPTTYDELKNVLKTLAEKKKVIALTAPGIGFIRESVFQNINPGSSWWQKVNGQWQPGWMTDAYAEQVAQIRDLYKSGLLDKDFALPNMDAAGKFMQGKAAALVNTVKNLPYDVPAWQKANPGTKMIDHVKILPPVPAADGKNHMYGYFDYWSGTLFGGNTTDEKQKRILALDDWLASPEGQKIMKYGIEGVDWDANGDKVVNKHASDSNFDLAKVYPSATLFTALATWTDPTRYVEGYGVSEVEQTQKYLDETEAQQLKTGEKPPINWVVNAYASSLNTGGGDLDALVTKLVIGNDDIKASLKKFADEQMGLGLADAIKHVNDKFKDEK